MEEPDGSCTSFGRRSTFESLEESEASLERGKDDCETPTIREKVRECMGISFWWKRRDLAKYVRSRFNNKEIGDTTEVRQRSEWEFLVPRDRDWERHETSCERDQKNRDSVPEKSGDCCKPDNISRNPWWCWSSWWCWFLEAVNKFMKLSMLSSSKECRM